jgi:hypothetical protein
MPLKYCGITTLNSLEGSSPGAQVEVPSMLKLWRSLPPRGRLSTAWSTVLGTADGPGNRL